MKRAFGILKNQRGVALLVAIFAIMIMTFIATEVSYDTSVEYVMARSQVNRLKAYYAARSGVEISLLRILIFKKAAAALSQALGPDQLQAMLPMIDPIWSMPFAWPPLAPEGASTADKDTLASLIKDSTLDSQYAAYIYSEGGKIDLNDLGSAAKGIRDYCKAQILKIFTHEIEHNQEFWKKYRDFKFEELVNNMVDWVDEDSESLNGGDEKARYDVRSDYIPPNSAFKTIKELNMVAGMNEDFFRLLEPRVTLFGTKGVNINYAPQTVIEALDPTMNEAAVNAIVKRRSDPQEGGLFKNEEDFFGYASRFGVNVQAIQKSGVPLLFGPEYNFRVSSAGKYGNVVRDITAITFDQDNLITRYLGILDKEAQKNQTNPAGSPQTSPPANPNPGANPAPTATDKPKIAAPKGRPTVVYWEEN